MFLDALVALPLKIISFIPEPLRLLDEFSPITHFIASTILDFPDPLGPIIPFKLSLKDSVVSSEKDLNPVNLILLMNNFNS